jgi:hypothetical protein
VYVFGGGSRLGDVCLSKVGRTHIVFDGIFSGGLCAHSFSFCDIVVNM